MMGDGIETALDGTVCEAAAEGEMKAASIATAEAAEAAPLTTSEAEAEVEVEAEGVSGVGGVGAGDSATKYFARCIEYAAGKVRGSGGSGEESGGVSAPLMPEPEAVGKAEEEGTCK